MTECTPEDFVRFWQQANSAEEVSKLLGESVWTTRQRAYRYRRLGIQLKFMPSGKKKHLRFTPELVARLRDVASETATGKVDEQHVRPQTAAAQPT